MRFSLVICTYMRPQPLFKLLKSVTTQTLYPDEILIIDGSTNNDTKTILEENPFKNLKYYKVDDSQRGLTKQRNFGVNQVGNSIDVVCFLDDDTVLEPDYFKEVLNTFLNNPEIIGVGGVDTGQAAFEKISSGADAVQLYTGMVYKGPGVVKEMKKELISILKRENIKNIREAIGINT